MEAELLAAVLILKTEGECLYFSRFLVGSVMMVPRFFLCVPLPERESV